MPTTVARGTGPRPLNHGTVNAYGNQGCRCGECVEAWRVYQREVKRANRVPYATRVAIAVSRAAIWQPMTSQFFFVRSQVLTSSLKPAGDG
jgi:hypothetical protein